VPEGGPKVALDQRPHGCQPECNEGHIRQIGSPSSDFWQSKDRQKKQWIPDEVFYEGKGQNSLIEHLVGKGIE
jgi:hypothetical protein